MWEFLTQRWPWYVAGPLIGLFVPLLLLITGKPLGISSNFQHACSLLLPGKKPDYLNYDWKKVGGGGLMFALGIGIGGFFGAHFLSPEGLRLLPEIAFTPMGAILMIVGGFLVGFGTRYGNGCTSGHAISGLSGLHLSSFIAVCSFFGSGMATAWILRYFGF